MRTRRSFRLVLYTLMLAGLVLSALAFLNFNGSSAPQAQAQAPGAEECQVFPETGFSVCGRFLEYWRTHGGLAQQGFPISEPFEEQQAFPPAGDGKIHKVQYFQRARFEYHYENAYPNDVLLGLLGTEQNKSKYNMAEFITIRDRRVVDKIADHVAKPGSSYLMLDLLFKNTTPKEISISPASISVKSQAQYDYNVDNATYALTNNLHFARLLPGETLGGFLVFEIPNSDRATSLVVDYFVAKATIGL